MKGEKECAVLKKKRIFIGKKEVACGFDDQVNPLIAKAMRTRGKDYLIGA
jgi:hypothetical protein